MAPLSAAQLIALWEPSAAPAHRRLEPLLAALDPGRAIDRDTLGARNRRLLALHAELGEASMEARLRCASCGTDNEFTVPAADILACPAPPPTARVTIRCGRRRLTFRLPHMADLAAAAGAGPDDALHRIVARCRIGGAADDPVPAAVLARLSARFEALDPAARIVVDLSCAECRSALRASVDIAEFVAIGIDRMVERLFREIHVVAQAYGWTEAAILALPAERRRRYVAMIVAAGAGAQPARTPQALRA